MHSIIEEISINNQWREGEFARYKKKPRHIDEILWCRMCVPMIYAHWEGFVIDALKILLQHLNKLDLVYEEIKTNLVVKSLEKAYKPLSGKQSFNQCIVFTEQFYDKLKNKVKFEVRVDTKSNLRSDVLEEICLQFGFRYHKFKDVEADVNKLVNVRNRIAHGENSIVPDYKNIERYIESITLATDILLNEIEYFLMNKQYLK